MSADDPRDPAQASGEHPTRDQLASYLDDRLPEKESAEVGDHLERCGRCVAALDELTEGAALPPMGGEAGPPAYDERWMRRAVRRTLFSVAWRAVLLAFVVLIVAELAGALLVHPLLVERGDRLQNHVAASIDLPVMLRPGAEVGEVVSETGVVRRTTEVRLRRTVGARSIDLGSYETRLGPLAMSASEGGPVLAWRGPRLSGDPVDGSAIPFDPTRAADGTAATVEFVWFDTLAPDVVAELTAGYDDVALTWVGFRIRDLPVEDPASRLGYGACADAGERILADTFGEVGGNFGFSGTFRAFPAPAEGTAHALEQLRSAVDNLAATGWLGDESTVGEGALADVAGTAEWLQANEPPIASVVLTGPTTALAKIVAEAGPDQANLLELDLDRGAPDPCG